MDDITLKRIQTLHPLLREEATQLYDEINEALTGRAMVRFTQALRTIEEQDGLYAQGRSKPGKIVTNAKGGTSYHNYGLAVDIVLILENKQISWDMKTDYDDDNFPDWMECVRIFESHGWEWGGRWISFKDFPHFQKTFGYSIKQLQNTDRIEGYPNISAAL